MMTRAQETLAIALHIEREYGAGGSVFIAEQLGAAALADDRGGIARWQEIAAAYHQLQKGSPQ